MSDEDSSIACRKVEDHVPSPPARQAAARPPAAAARRGRCRHRRRNQQPGPQLRKNVGLSMGSGTSVARTPRTSPSGRLLRLDRHGRRNRGARSTATFSVSVLFENFTINFVAILICFIGALFGTEMPLTVVQILWRSTSSWTPSPPWPWPPLPPSEESHARQTPRPRRIHHLPGHGLHRSFLLRNRHGRRPARNALRLDPPRQGSLSIRQFDPLLLLRRSYSSQFWNMFNAKGFRNPPLGLHLSEGVPRILPHPRRTGIGQFLIVEFGGQVFRTVPSPGRSGSKSSDAPPCWPSAARSSGKSAEKIAAKYPDAMLKRTILLLDARQPGRRGRSPTNRQRRLERRRRIPKTNRPPHLHENLSDALRRSAPDRRRRRHAVLRLRFPAGSATDTPSRSTRSMTTGSSMPRRGDARHEGLRRPKPEPHWGRMLVSDAFSAGLMAIAVNSLKYTCRVRRPDGSSRNSFPRDTPQPPS